MGDTQILGEEGRKELIKILENYWSDPAGGSGMITINPESIHQITSTDDYVLMGYEGREIYMFKGDDPRYVEAMLKLAHHLLSEGFAAYRGMNQTRYYLIVDKNKSA